jgi:hypothetical protein
MSKNITAQNTADLTQLLKEELECMLLKHTLNKNLNSLNMQAQLERFMAENFGDGQYTSSSAENFHDTIGVDLRDEFDAKVEALLQAD